MDAKWLGTNSLFVYPCKFSTDHAATKDVHGLFEMKEMRWNVDIQNSITRKLINETHGIFLDLQELGIIDRNQEKTEYVKISHCYRSIIQSCIIELKNQLNVEQNKDMLTSMETQLDLLGIIEMIWHLCEILLIDSKPGGYCLSQLVEWVKSHFTEADRSAQIVMSWEDPYSHPEYWSTIYSFIMQGRLTEAATLLTHHPSRDQARFDEFASIDELLKKMPTFQVYKGQSVNEFISKWKQWQQECSRRLKDGDFSRYPELERICEILTGQESSLERNRDLCKSWYQLMVAKLLFTDPAVTVFNLKKHAVSCIEIFNGFSNLTPLDEIVLAVMAFDVHKIVEKTSSCLPSWWFVSHLTDLLFHCNMLTIQEPNYGEKLREFLLLEYSASLMSHSSLWRIAADYLMVCPINGKNHLEAYIEKLPLENETKALKVINLCNQHGFTEQVTNICKVMGMKALRRKRFGVALSWCIRSKDQGFASFLTDQFLTHYDETGRFVHPDLIENLGSAMLMNNKLTFLAQYYEFHKLYGDRKLKEAGSLLTSLLNSGLAPKRFWSILLLDAIPLLMNDEIIFDSSQTYELIHFLKELELCVDSTDSIRDWKPKPTTKAEEENEQNKLQLLQLGLSRNLSRSLLAEAATEAVR